MKNNNLPNISIITVVYNFPLEILEKTLKAIANQDYPKEKIEHLVIDGGSTNGTKEFVEKYGCKFIDRNFKTNIETGRSYCLKEAKNEILIFLDADNILTEPDWLKRMVRPTLEDEKVFAVQTLRYAYVKSDNIYNRYFSLFGFSDPVVYYLGKTDRLTHFEKGWTKSKVLSENNNYYTVEFNENNLPTVGCNGFLVKKSILSKAKSDPDNFFHTDVILDLLKLGYNRFAIVKNDVHHYTSPTLRILVKKRLGLANLYKQSTYVKRRYLIFDPKSREDKLNLIKFVICTITAIQPLYLSLKGFLKIRDPAWFLHPLICPLFLASYGLFTLKLPYGKNLDYRSFGIPGKKSDRRDQG